MLFCFFLGGGLGFFVGVFCCFCFVVVVFCFFVVVFFFFFGGGVGEGVIFYMKIYIDCSRKECFKIIPMNIHDILVLKNIL